MRISIPVTDRRESSVINNDNVDIMDNARVNLCLNEYFTLIKL